MSGHRSFGVIGLVLASAWSVAFPTEPSGGSIRRSSEAARLDEYVIPIPLGLIYPTFPLSVGPRRLEYEVGERLFNERALSADGSMSCATCHMPSKAFADGQRVSQGIGGTTSRNTPTVLNSAFLRLVGWDGRHESLEAQALDPIVNKIEMALPAEEIVERVSAKYSSELVRLYGEVSPEAVGSALAAYQRTLVSADSAFDRYMFNGERSAISESARRGFKIFLRHGRCIQCHVIRCEECHPFGGHSAFFTNERFHNLGVGFDKEQGFSDLGRATVTGDPRDSGAFRTPSLRNVALTAPYMHDGSLETLEDVVEFYDKGGEPNPYLDPEIRALHLRPREKEDLVEFLKSLTSCDLVEDSDLMSSCSSGQMTEASVLTSRERTGGRR